MKSISLLLLLILAGCQVSVPLDLPWNVDAVDDVVDVANVQDSADSIDGTDTAEAIDTSDAVDAEDALDAPDGQDGADATDIGATDSGGDAGDSGVGSEDATDADADSLEVFDSEDGVDATDAADVPDVATDTTGDTVVADPCATLNCDDGQACTNDSCANGSCVHLPNPGTCTDGNACTMADNCADGKCGGIAVNCDDGEICTDDNCIVATGCVHLANTATCSDGDACTIGDACKDGLCGPGGQVNCADGNTCTEDSCADGVCVNLAINVTCSDGNACTMGDACSDKVCVAIAEVPCDDGNVCTGDGCDPATGCVHLANATTCEDGSPCTLGDMCANKACGSGAAVDCNDGVTCTTDSCNAASGLCEHPTATEVPCSDGNACTGPDVCGGTGNGPACGGPAKSCDDGNACTDDACDAVTGCSHTANSQPCDDHNACTGGDTCFAISGSSLCLGTAIDVGVVCDDGNVCTADTCEPVFGCKSTPKGGACDDSNPCTQNDKCGANGSCTPGDNVCACASNADCTQPSDLCAGTLYCDKDAVPYYCKIDPLTVVKCDASQDGQCKQTACDSATGKCATTSLPDSKPCDADGSACTPGDSCQAGTCTTGAALGCDDSNSCTSDACDPNSGCTHANTTAACDDANACTTSDTCSGGTCIGAAIVCAASDQCHDAGSCNGGTCSNPVKADGAGCSDGNPCTAGDSCASGACTSGVALACDDGNTCTDDSCIGTGCAHVNNTAACTDGSACVINGTCSGGSCSGGQAALGEWVIPAASQFIDITPTSDGGFVAVGVIGTKGYVARIDATGAVTWSYTSAGVADYHGVAIASDGTIYVVGSDSSTGWYATGIAFSPTGVVKWQKIWSVAGSAKEVFVRDDGSLRVVGQNTASSNPRHSWWGSVSATGTLTKQVALGSRNDSDEHVSFQINGTQTLTASVDANYGNVWWNVLDDTGVTLRSGSVVVPAAWTNIEGCALDTKQRLLCVGQSGTSQYSGYKGWGFQLDAAGNVLWQGYLWGALTSNVELSAVAILPGGDALIAGQSNAWPSTSASVGFARLENSSTLGQTSFPYATPGKNDFIKVLRVLPSGVIVAAGQKKSGTTTGGLILRMDPWMHTTCQTSGACTTQFAKGCDDGVQCTADLCDPTTGCSHSALSVNSACDGDDGTSCTTDLCNASAVCVSAPTVCTALDQCHNAGTCSAGVCSNPTKSNGTTCSDSNSCTTSDSCTNGTCSGTTIVCTASDQCHSVGTCSGGTCSNPAKSNGTACNDGSACTSGETCVSGTCSATVNCDDGNACTNDSCVNLACQHVSVSDGTACTDGNSCTASDACQGGACIGGQPSVWTQTYGGGGADYIYAVAQAADGGFALAGYSSSVGTNGGNDFYLIKTTSSGVQSWTKWYGGSDDDHARAILATTDGGFALAGSTKSKGAGNYDMWLVRTDSAGTKLWDQTYGGTGEDYSRAVLQTSDGGFALMDSTLSKGAGGYDIWLVRTDSNGAKLWDQSYGGTANDGGGAFVETPDLGFAIAGYTISKGAGKMDFWLVRVDEKGNKLWDQTYGGTGDDQPLGLARMADGGFALGGVTSSTGAGGQDYWLVRTDSNGNKLWSQTYGGASDDGANALVSTTDGGFILTGYTYSKGAGFADEWLVRTDARGNKLWDTTYGGSAYEYGEALVKISNSGLATAGYKTGASNNSWLLRTDLWGATTCAASGNCAGFTTATCDDSNQCTQDLCTSAAGCTHNNWPTSTPCSDSNACTSGETCNASAACTGATNVSTGSPCDDGNACTSADTCASGACTPGSAVTCATNATCSSNVGCVCNGGFWGSGISGGSCSCGGTVTSISTAAGSKNVCTYDYPVWGERGISPNTYKDNGDGTVSDSQTQLMWQQVTTGTYTWATAATYCDGLTLAGHDDWRLPTVAELESLVDYTLGSPDINAAAFPAAVVGKYWSATGFAGPTFQDWFVNFDTLSGPAVYAATSTSLDAARCVRSSSGLPATATRFTVGGGGSGTVLDNPTTLYWQRTVSSSLYSSDTTGASGSANAYCASLSLGTFTTGWRVPTQRELLGLVDRSLYNPPINASAFPSTPAEVYWSSTSFQDSSQEAWCVYFDTGGSVGNALDNTFRVRCVHD